MTGGDPVKRFCALVKKHKDIFLYLFFGVLTTAVNFLIYIPLYDWLHWSAACSNIFAWVAAVLFAFITNKPFVFQSRDWSRIVVLPELGKFVGSRVFSGALETGLIAFTVDLLKWDGILMKILGSVIVIVLNYVASKWIVFTDRKTDTDK